MLKNDGKLVKEGNPHLYRCSLCSHKLKDATLGVCRYKTFDYENGRFSYRAMLCATDDHDCYSKYEAGERAARHTLFELQFKVGCQIEADALTDRINDALHDIMCENSHLHDSEGTTINKCLRDFTFGGALWAWDDDPRKP